MSTGPRYCAHPNAEEVRSGGELVAGLCPNCDAQLPAEWFSCSHSRTVEMTSLGERPGRRICNDCGTTFFDPDRAIRLDMGRVMWLP